MIKIPVFPERYARLIIQRRNLTPPIDVESLVKEYAKLVYDDIPVPGIDGVSINIKVPGKNDLVIVNSNMPISRQRFTLAHELGHIIIPWHVGDLIIDLLHIDNKFYKDMWSHQEIERQANQFAAELLMPEVWVKELYNRFDTLGEIHQYITDEANVSPAAAAYRIISTCPDPVAFCEADILRTVHSFVQSPSAKIYHFDKSQKLDTDVVFRGINSEYSKSSASGIGFYHWWRFKNEELTQFHVSSKTWREILDRILVDTNVSKDEIPKVKARLNGVISAANSELKREPGHSPEGLFAACMRRLQRDHFGQIVRHPDFKEFLSKRVSDFFP